MPEQLEPVPIGEAVALRPGRDVTVVALSRLVHEALAAAERLSAEDGIEAEVIDPRTLVPLDLDAIVSSVERTDRLVVAHEAVEQGASGPRSPPACRRPRSTTSTRRWRASGRRSPRCRFSAPLEDAYVPGADEIVAAVRGLR